MNQQYKNAEKQSVSKSPNVNLILMFHREKKLITQSKADKRWSTLVKDDKVEPPTKSLRFTCHVCIHKRSKMWISYLDKNIGISLTCRIIDY